MFPHSGPARGAEGRNQRGEGVPVTVRHTVPTHREKAHFPCGVWAGGTYRRYGTAHSGY
jgi:hypothetical protein